MGGIEGGARYALLEISGCFGGRKGHVGRCEDGDNVEEVAQEGEKEQIHGKTLAGFANELVRGLSQISMWPRIKQDRLTFFHI